MALAWVIHMVLIAKSGSVYFIEENPVILYGEIVATVVIILFSIFVFVLQYKRLWERRTADDIREGTKVKGRPTPSQEVRVL
jgi:hypothetical protein